MRGFRSRSRGPRMRDSTAAGDHPVMSAKQELHHLEQVAEDGVSNETPLILLGFNIVLWAAIVLVLTAVALLAYRLGS